MERPWYLVCWPCVTQQRIRQKYQKIDLRNQNFIFTTTSGALQSTEGGRSGEVVVASGDAAMGVAGLRRALGGRHAAHGGRGAGQAAAAAGRGARRRERWKSGRATRRATGDGAASFYAGARRGAHRHGGERALGGVRGLHKGSAHSTIHAEQAEQPTFSPAHQKLAGICHHFIEGGYRRRPGSLRRCLRRGSCGAARRARDDADC